MFWYCPFAARSVNNHGLQMHSICNITLTKRKTSHHRKTFAENDHRIGFQVSGLAVWGAICWRACLLGSPGVKHLVARLTPDASWWPHSPVGCWWDTCVWKNILGDLSWGKSQMLWQLCLRTSNIEGTPKAPSRTSGLGPRLQGTESNSLWEELKYGWFWGSYPQGLWNKVWQEAGKVGIPTERCGGSSAISAVAVTHEVIANTADCFKSNVDLFKYVT